MGGISARFCSSSVSHVDRHPSLCINSTSAQRKGDKSEQAITASGLKEWTDFMMWWAKREEKAIHGSFSHRKRIQPREWNMAAGFTVFLSHDRSPPAHPGVVLMHLGIARVTTFGQWDVGGCDIPTD